MRYSELIQIAAEKGYKVDKVNIWRMVKDGIFPVSVLQHLGKQGNQASFPTGSDKQLLEICRYKAINNDMNFVVWNLWLNEYYVSIERIKDVIMKGIEGYESVINSIIRLKLAGLDGLDIAHKIIEDENIISKLSPKEKKLLSINRQDASLLTLIVRLFIGDKSILDDLYYDVLSKESDIFPANEQIYVNKLQNFAKQMFTKFIKHEAQFMLPQMLEALNTHEIINCFDDFLALAKIDKMKETVRTIETIEDLRPAQILIKSFVYLNFLDADWQNPSTSFFAAIISGNNDIKRLNILGDNVKGKGNRMF